MNLLSVITGKKEPEFIQATRPLSLDELFEECARYGTLETGSWGANNAELKLNFTGGDYVSLKSKDKNSLKENIQDVLSRAKKLKEVWHLL